MDRKIYKDLLAWKADSAQKPLLLKGARQVGKTYILKFFGQKEFPQYHHFDFMKDKNLNRIFEDDLDPNEIIKRLEIQFDIKIERDKDLIIFDEIQECPRAITALKYFSDDLNKVFVIGSGSFLGLELSDSSYPVGKIKTLTLYPMSFFEFLDGLEKTALCAEIKNGTLKNKIPASIHDKAFEYLKYYFITGGLPEVVCVFKTHFSDPSTAFNKVRELQIEILNNYISDMAKYSGKINAVKIQTVFENIPIQLARENKSNSKFIFKDVLPKKSNFILLEDPISWLEKTGLVHKVLICKQAKPPLKAFTDQNKFKLFIFDIGLLGTMIGLKPKEIYNYDYGSYKGYFAENYVVQEFKQSFNKPIYSWQEGTSEIEFLTELASGITPVEVKAGINKKAKSLGVFLQKYQPQKSYLISGAPIALKKTGLSFLPLYAASLIGQTEQQ